MNAEQLDDACVAAIAARDAEALAAAYETLADPLFRYLRSRCGDVDLAADVVEATFLELIHDAPALTGGASGLRRWLFTAGRHNLIDEQRKHRRRQGPPLETVPGAPAGTAEGSERDPVMAAPPDPEPGPEQRVVAAARDAEVRRALARLPDDQQEVLELRFAAELSAAEIGAIMRRSPGAVRVLQHRALRALEAALGPRDPQAPEEPERPADHGLAASAPPRGPPQGPA